MVWEVFFLAMLLAILAAAAAGSGMMGVDVSTALTVEQWKCLHEQYGVEFFITRGWRSVGRFDPSAVTNWVHARAAGFGDNGSSVYLFPCATQNATEQVRQLIGNLSSSFHDMPLASWTVWIDVEWNPSPQCAWPEKAVDRNCAYVWELAKSVQRAGLWNVGVYSSRQSWKRVFVGNAAACPEAAAWPLWYAHDDGHANGHDWSAVAFGGWWKHAIPPVMKQFQANQVLCGGATVDWNVRLGASAAA